MTERSDLPKDLTTDVEKTRLLLDAWGVDCRDELKDLPTDVAHLLDECVALTIDTCAEALRLRAAYLKRTGYKDSVVQHVRDMAYWLQSSAGLEAVGDADRRMHATRRVLGEVLKDTRKPATPSGGESE